MNHLNLIGLVLNFVGSLILGFGMIRSKDRIEKESGSYWDENPHTKRFFYTDRKIGMFGIGLLSLGFLLQLVAFQF
jgi:hypothetical protein